MNVKLFLLFCAMIGAAPHRANAQSAHRERAVLRAIASFIDSSGTSESRQGTRTLRILGERCEFFLSGRGCVETQLKRIRADWIAELGTGSTELVSSRSQTWRVDLGREPVTDEPACRVARTQVLVMPVTLTSDTVDVSFMVYRRPASDDCAEPESRKAGAVRLVFGRGEARLLRFLGWLYID